MDLNYPGGQSLGSGVIAYLSSNMTNVTGDGSLLNINFDTPIINVGGNYAAGTYSLPYKGAYQVDYIISFNSPTVTPTRQFFSVFDGQPWNSRGFQVIQSGDGDYVLSASTIIEGDIGDQMKILFGVFDALAKDVTIYGENPKGGSQARSTMFSCILLGTT